MSLKDLYERVGSNPKAILAADNDIQELYYAGEKKPHIWWGEFEIRLTNEFVIVDKDAGCQVHTEESKLRLLNERVCAEFLTTMKMTIEIQMSATPMTMNYSSALANYRNTVNQRFPNESTIKSNNRRIQTKYSRGVRG